MIEPKRTPEYRKDLKQEQKLKNLNALLAPIEEQLISRFDKPRLPIVFIVGVPRSGSTLLAQILAQTGTFTYVSNFVARFWMAPYVGMLIEDTLGIRRAHPVQSFVSRYGVTEGWTGPHEFGYFWSRWFHFGNTHKLGARELAEINRDKLCKELAALESLYNKPLFFKSLTCGLQISFLAEVLEKTVFVLCRRNPVYNMQSLLIGRTKVLGSKQCWFSLKPKEYPELLPLSPYEQIAGQVYYVLKDIEAAFSSLSSERFLQIRYEDLCSQPRAEVKKIVDAVGQLGAAIDWDPNVIPDHFEPTDVQRVSNEEFQRLREAAKRYFAGDELE